MSRRSVTGFPASPVPGTQLTADFGRSEPALSSSRNERAICRVVIGPFTNVPTVQKNKPSRVRRNSCLTWSSRHCVDISGRSAASRQDAGRSAIRVRNASAVGADSARSLCAAIVRAIPLRRTLDARAPPKRANATSRSPSVTPSSAHNFPHRAASSRDTVTGPNLLNASCVSSVRMALILPPFHRTVRRLRFELR